MKYRLQDVTWPCSQELTASVVTSTRPVSTHGATLTGLSGLLSQKGEDMKKDGEHVIKMYCFYVQNCQGGCKSNSKK